MFINIQWSDVLFKSDTQLIECISFEKRLRNSCTTKITYLFNMPSTRRFSYDLNFKLRIVVEAEAFNNNREFAHKYGIYESIVRKWCKHHDVLFSGELKMTAKRVLNGCYRLKDPQLDQILADRFSKQQSQGEHSCFQFIVVRFMSQVRGI